MGDRIREGGGEAYKRMKPHKRCRRDMENGGDLAEIWKNIDKKSVAADPYNLESSKESGREATGTQSLRKNYYIVSENVSPLLPLIRGLRNKDVDPPFRGSKRVACND